VATPFERELSEGAWAARLPASHAHRAAALRARTDVEAAEHGDSVWLRGDASNAELEVELKSLPDLERFHVIEDDHLVPAGMRVPSARLPASKWTPVRSFFALEAFSPAFAGSYEQRTVWKMMRDAREEPANALIVDLEAFVAWCETAPRARLLPLEFAVSEDRRALVRGTPLPPIVGLPLVLHERVARAAGWRSDPDLDAPSLLQLFGAGADDIALLLPPDTWEIVPASAFVRATRSAARTTRTESRRG
jgi:hypothetical protein